MVVYTRPSDLGEALSVLREADGAGRVLVGGTDLLPSVRRNPLVALVFVDVKWVSDMPPAIEVTDHAVHFGPTASMSDLATDPRLDAWFPALVASSRVVGSVAIRNRATLIGNICNASPAADTAPPLLVHGATVSILGTNGVRSIPLADFFVGPGATTCGDDEIVTRISLPRTAARGRSVFHRLTRRRGVDLATVSVAARITANGAINLGLGAVGPTPLLVSSGPSADGAKVDEQKRIVSDLVEAATPISDVRATSEYRRAMTLVLAQRAVHDALRVAA